ncbi:DgsA anti-repressor MtfA [Acerihabitans arboris]|uniref:Mlc titration factor A n=1 Tax=Acerihabitans arboris TaxID=2691583 RepID=A0A845SJ48_9GAMM|nr:DgsA anti-repressor MtfA [Acerihabitans arboris]NDL62658.1 DgsA anti-repressor MtfA [Acerihabitans arboris]
MMKWPWKSSTPSAETLALWQEALAIPLFSPLSADEQHALVLLAGKFLQQKKLVALQGLVLDEVMEARIALMFALPVLGLGIEWLDGFHEVVIYPAPFVVNDEWRDEFGLVHRGEVVHSGQSWDQGPIVLNWQEIQDSFDLCGFNLVIHETAHKLDARNAGVVNGVPLISLRDVVHWETLLHAAMENLQDEVDLVGEDAASMDAYAASDPAECFAVLSEYFFSSTELLTERFPELYRCFVQFYRQDPLARLGAQRLAGT